jgi:hypothetical protein
MNLFKLYIKSACCFFLFMLFTLGVWAQASVSIQTDKQEIVLGDYVHVILTYTQLPLNATLVLPDIAGELSKEIQLVALSSIDTINDNNTLTITEKFIVSGYKDGDFQIPSFTLKYQYNGQWNTLVSESKALKVNTVAVDTTQDIKDINDIIQVEKPNEILHLIILGVLVMYLIFGLWYFFKNKSKEELAPKAKPLQHISLNLYDKYLHAVQQLASREYVSHNEFKPFYTELSEILRSYLSERYHIPALEQTTQEILKATKHMSGAKKQRPHIKEVLGYADLIKFAKANATSEIAQQHIALVIQILKETRLREV